MCAGELTELQQEASVVTWENVLGQGRGRSMAAAGCAGSLAMPGSCQCRLINVKWLFQEAPPAGMTLSSPTESSAERMRGMWPCLVNKGVKSAAFSRCTIWKGVLCKWSNTVTSFFLTEKWLKCQIPWGTLRLLFFFKRFIVHFFLQHE